MPTTTPAPLYLLPDNFTPRARTPWGGQRIARKYKATLALPTATVIGESWEVSVEPSFPSRVTATNAALAAVIAAAPRQWLGAADARRYGQTNLLVKLLDAAEPLSVQVHPADGDPHLAADESGKPEAWIVLDADPGAGLYLGFADGVQRADVARCLQSGAALDQLMNFVPVTPGDAFVIEAGTAHAIGPGLTLLEPQHVAPGRRGLTYRFWDWNRRYDRQGQPDAGGAPRELHVERSLAVTAWQAPRGAAFVDSCRARPQTLGSGPVSVQRLIDWRWFQVERYAGSGAAQLVTHDRLLALTCTRGQVQLAGEDAALACGQSAVLPACGESFTLDLQDAELFVTHTPSD